MLAPHKPKPAPHVVVCPDCAGSGRESRNLCCGGQGCRTCDVPCATCRGVGSVDGYLTCDGEIVDASFAELLHRDREDRACPIEDCRHCADDLAEAKRMYGHGNVITREPTEAEQDEAFEMRRQERMMR